MDSNSFRDFLRRLETLSLAASYSRTLNAVAQGSIARSFVAELARGLRRCGYSESEISFCAVARVPIVGKTWYWLDLPVDGPDAFDQTRSLMPPDAVSAYAKAKYDELPDAEIMISDRPRGGVEEWFPTDHLHTLYLSRVRVGEDDHDLDLDALVLLGSRTNTTESAIDLGDCVAHATQCVRDRLRLAFAAEPRSLRIATTMDDAYQLRLLQARTAPGLEAILSEIADGGGLSPVPALPAIDGLSELDGSSDWVETLLTIERDRTRKAAVQALSKMVPGGFDLKLAVHSNEPLETESGPWLGWGQWRRGTVLVGAAVDESTVQRHLAAFVAAREREPRRRRLHLILLSPAGASATLRANTSSWCERFPIYYVEISHQQVQQ
jgi:hypothetical protein